MKKIVLFLCFILSSCENEIDGNLFCDGSFQGASFECANALAPYTSRTSIPFAKLTPNTILVLKTDSSARYGFLKFISVDDDGANCTIDYDVTLWDNLGLPYGTSYQIHNPASTGLNIDAAGGNDFINNIGPDGKCHFEDFGAGARFEIYSILE